MDLNPDLASGKAALSAPKQLDCTILKPFGVCSRHFAHSAELFHGDVLPHSSKREVCNVKSKGEEKRTTLSIPNFRINEQAKALFFNNISYYVSLFPDITHTKVVSVSAGTFPTRILPEIAPFVPSSFTSEGLTVTFIPFSVPTKEFRVRVLPLSVTFVPFTATFREFTVSVVPFCVTSKEFSARIVPFTVTVHTFGCQLRRIYSHLSSFWCQRPYLLWSRLTLFLPASILFPPEFFLFVSRPGSLLSPSYLLVPHPKKLPSRSFLLLYQVTSTYIIPSF